MMLGFETITRSDDHCHMVIAPRSTVLDGKTGRIDPGAVTVLIDQCLGIAASGMVPRAMVTLDLRIDWNLPSEPGVAISCLATVRTSQHDIVCVTAEIRSGVDGPLLGVASGQFLIGAVAGGFRDAPNRDAARKYHSAALSLQELPNFHDFLAVKADGDGVYILDAQDRFIGSPFLPALHGGVTAAALREALYTEALTWRPDESFQMLSWTTQFLLAGQAKKPLRMETNWIRRGKSVAVLQARATQDDRGKAVASAQAMFTAIKEPVA